MKLGAFMMPLHPPDKDRTECFEEDIDLIVLADELGFTEAWIGQHHTVAWEPIPSNDVFIGNVLPRTKNIRLGTGVSIIPQHHPVNTAVRLAFLDHLARGRLNCGFGQGGVATDWGLFDLPDPKTQGLMTMEAIDTILKLWQTDPPFEFNGDFWNIKLETLDHERGNWGTAPTLPKTSPTDRYEHCKRKLDGSPDSGSTRLYTHKYEPSAGNNPYKSLGNVLRRC